MSLFREFIRRSYVTDIGFDGYFEGFCQFVAFNRFDDKMPYSAVAAGSYLRGSSLKIGSPNYHYGMRQDSGVYLLQLR